MKLHLEEIHLRNFRIHKDYVFRPAEEGITAIVGRNGKGKSSIIDGLAWALYGTRPNTSIKNSSWRRIGAPKDEPSFVEVKLTLEDQNIVVKRSIVNPKNGATKCECWLDGEHVAGPAVSHAKRWIVSTLGLDENSFLSTILVQQKHVDELVSASPKERRFLLERLTGIEAVSNALDKAKEERKRYTTIVDSMGIHEDQLPKLEKEEKDNLAKADRIIKEIETLKTKLGKLDDEGRSLSNDVKSMEAIASDMIALKEKSAVLESRINESENRLKELESRKKDLRKSLPEVMASTADMQKMKSDLASREAGMSDLQRKDADVRSALAGSPDGDDFNDLKDRISEIRKNIADTDEDSVRKSRKEAEDRIGTAKAAIRQARKSMSELGDDASTCPTCLQPIKDPEHVKKELDGTISSSKTIISEQEPIVAELDGRLASLSTMNDELKDSLRTMKDYQKARKRADEAAKHAMDIKAEIATVDVEIKSLRKTIGRFDADAVKRSEYERTASDYIKVTDSLSADNSELKKVKEDMKTRGKGYTERKLDRMRKKLDDMRSRKTSLKTDLASRNGDLKVFRTKADSAKREADSLKEQMDKRSDLMSKLEVSEGAVGILDVFKEHVILSAIPQVTDYASDLVMQISDGRFSSIVIDDDFNIKVESGDGAVADVAQLSGGETSLVAICIRLAISVMLSGGSPSLLVLDEVLTAMDSDRAQAILEAMQNMAGDGQIIIVAHNEIVKSIADKVVDLNES